MRAGASRRVLRQFAGAWLVVFGALACKQLVQGNRWAGGAYAALAGAVGLWGLVRPDAIRLVYLACMALATPIGRVVSELLMACLFYGLNAWLPESIAVRCAAEVDETFDPRRHASRRAYRYLISLPNWP